MEIIHAKTWAVGDSQGVVGSSRPAAVEVYSQLVIQ